MNILIRLISDTAFGRGDGVVGVVDSEIEHDKATGLPIIKGRTIKGLLVESCADLLYAIRQIDTSLETQLASSAARLFGKPGSDMEDAARLHIGIAKLPPTLITRVQQGQYTTQDVLDAMTTIRYQTAVERKSGTPQQESLRATRVVLRETIFVVPLTITGALENVDLELLAACIAQVRRAGQNRTRGLGHIEMQLVNTEIDYFTRFINRLEAVS